MPGQVTIARLALAARAPRSRPPRPGLAGELREAAERLLAPQLAQALEAVLPQGDGVLLIRSLSVDIAVLARWDPARIAARLAAAIAEAIARALREEGPGILRIRDGATHRAQVLADVVAGRGALWHHGAHRQAADRPVPTALALLLETAGAEGPPALAATGPAMAARILRRIEPEAAARIALAWGVAPAPAAAPAPSPALRAAVAARAALPPDLAADPLRGPLLALALARTAAPDAEAAALAVAIQAVFAPAAPTPPMARRGTDPPSPAVARGQPAARPPGAAEDAPAPPVMPRAEGWVGVTWHAPLFLLWRDALETGALDHAANLAGGAEAGAAALARTLVGSGADPLADPAIRSLLGLVADPGPVPPARLPPAALLEALQAETWPPPNPAALVLEALPGEPPRWLLADAATATWLRLSARPIPGAPGLPLLLSVADAAMLGGGAQPAGDGRVWLLAGASVPAPLPPLARLPGRLARDAAALAPPGAPDAETALAWAVLGQHVVRRFARRLPGFAHAGLDWLRANMLPASAMLREARDQEGPQFLVCLDPPPLAPQLRMAGITPASYRLPGGAEVVLTFADG